MIPTALHAKAALGSWLWVGLAIPLALGCSKTPPGDAPSPALSVSAAPLALASAPSASASAPSAAPRLTAWGGSYAAKVGAVEPPKAAKEKAWTQDPGSAAVGNGTIEISITEPRGETRGETQGALGDMMIVGAFEDDEVRANLVPKTPTSDGAMTGFMVLKATGPSAMTGTLRVSNRDARIVREASVSLTKK